LHKRLDFNLFLSLNCSFLVQNFSLYIWRLGLTFALSPHPPKKKEKGKEKRKKKKSNLIHKFGGFVEFLVKD
jgi:hypothetical protein